MNGMFYKTVCSVIQREVILYGYDIQWYVLVQIH